MKAIVQDLYGGPDVLRLDEVERPTPGKRDVLVRVHAAGLDAGVWHVMRGDPYLVRLAFGLRRLRKGARVRGLDLSGVVEAVGAEVTRWSPGDEVYGVGNGSFAEWATASQDRLARKPANLSFTQAAVVPISACTALHALRDAGRVQPGQRVLVLGASGGVGSFAVQLARHFGAEVTAVCSAAKADLVRTLGATHVLDYTRDDPTDGARRYDLVLDIAGNRPLAHVRRALTPKGTLVLVGGDHGGRWLGGLERSLWAMLLSPFVGHTLRGLVSTERHDDLDLLRDLIEAGHLTPVLDRTFPLAETPAAVRYLEAGHARGKLAIAL